MADLELIKVSKRFGGVIALDEANLECFNGEVHGLVGENGAGKSTLVKILAAAVRRDSGDVRLNGRPLNLVGPREAIADGIGMVFQELSLLPDLTVAQNIFYGHEPLEKTRLISPRELRERCYALFDEMGIDVADPGQVVRELSLARRQTVEIAKILSRDPKVIILDEATSALGRAQADWLLEYSRRLADAGKIVIYISHKLSEIRHVSDRITVFRNGRDVGVRKRDEATTEELVGLILGRRMGRLYPRRESEIGNQAVLEVHQLQALPRLRGVTFALRRGEILGIGGLTGQGQDELFRALFGIERGQGQITLEGKAVVIRSPADALDQNFGLALVPEDRATQGLLLPKSVASNISLAVLSSLEKFGIVQRVQERKLVQKQVDRLGIKASGVNAPANQLSGGNQQKVVLAKLLATAPKVLMLFDSTRGVDVGTKAEIFQLLRELTASGSSILFYSTDSEELINMCDRILVMREGQIQAELDRTVGNLTEENLVRASLGEELAPSAEGALPAESVGAQPPHVPLQELPGNPNTEVDL